MNKHDFCCALIVIIPRPVRIYVLKMNSFKAVEKLYKIISSLHYEYLGVCKFSGKYSDYLLFSDIWSPSLVWCWKHELSADPYLRPSSDVKILILVNPLQKGNFTPDGGRRYGSAETSCFQHQTKERDRMSEISKLCS